MFKDVVALVAGYYADRPRTRYWKRIQLIRLRLKFSPKIQKHELREHPHSWDNWCWKSLLRNVNILGHKGLQTVEDLLVSKHPRRLQHYQGIVPTFYKDLSENDRRTLNKTFGGPDRIVLWKDATPRQRALLLRLLSKYRG